MTQEQNKMREAFIKWAEEEGHEIGYMGDEDFYPESALDMWIGWQARAAYEHALKPASTGEEV